MKLTNCLLRWAKPLPKGHLWHGKYKLYKPVTQKIVAEKRRAFELEERNMFYLRHPYLTIEQSENYAKSCNQFHKYIEAKQEEKRKNWKQHGLLGDRFGFLKVAEQWE